MAHELEFVNDRPSFMGKEDPWHHLGDVVNDNITTEMIIARAPHLLSDIEMRPTYVLGNDENPILTPRTGANVRKCDEKIVGEGLSKEGYGIVQPSEAWEFAQAISGGAMPCVSAGTLREGRQFFFSYERQSHEIQGIKMTPTVSVIGSHDGSLNIQVLFGTTIVVCANTLAWALDNASDRIRFRHTSNVKDRMSEARRAYSASSNHIEAMNEAIYRLTNLPIRNFEPLLDGVLPFIDTPGRSQTMRDQARAAIRGFLDSEYVGGHKNTAWAFVQAVNTYEGWVKPTRKSTSVSNNDRIAVRQFDSLVKQSQTLTARALALTL